MSKRRVTGPGGTVYEYDVDDGIPPEIGERDGVGAARLATTIMVNRDLPTFPRARGLDTRGRRWRMSEDVAMALRGLHVSPGSPQAVLQLPMVADELFGYPVDVDAAAPEWTLEMVE